MSATGEPWGGEERRKTSPALAELREDLGSIQQIMQQIVEAMGGFMPRGEVENAIRQERRDRFKMTMALAAAIAILLTFVLLSVAQMGQLRTVARSNNRILAEIDCVIRVAATVPTEQQPMAYGKCVELTTVTPEDRRGETGN